MNFEYFGIDPKKTPAQLSGTEFAQPSFRSSLTENATKYSNTPIQELNAEGVRLLLSQGFFLEYMIPAAIILLNSDPFTGGHLENGALMRTLFNVSRDEYWSRNAEPLRLASELLRSSRKILDEKLNSEQDPEELSLLEDANENFTIAEAKLKILCDVDL